MNRQETFDKVVNHLRQQGRRASVGNSNEPLGCRYRLQSDDDNIMLKCAIGCLIPDNKYNPKFEGESIIRLVNKFPEVEQILDIKDDQDLVLLQDLQRVHDLSDRFAEKETHFLEIAFRYELVYNPPL